MSDWRDSLARIKLPDGRRFIGASFRGVPFLVSETERSGGRRTVIHQFPGRDDPYVDDMGRDARKFKFDGYVIGSGYIAQKNALLAALEDVAGPGELVHPYYGRKRGICTQVSVRETVQDGGMARFSIDFTETPRQQLSPDTASDPAGEVATAADTAINATDTEFQSKYDVSGQPSYALASLSRELKARTAEMRRALGAVTATSQEIAKLDQAAKSVIASADELVRTPGDILGQFIQVMQSFERTLTTAPQSVMRALLTSFNLPAQILSLGDTATRQKERANQQALADGLKQVIVINAAILIPTVPYQTIDEAQADASSLIAALDDQIATAGDDVYPALLELRAAVTRAVPGDANLARQITIVRRVSLPSILLSYQLYGTTDEDADIVARNSIQHPGFISGSLKVLSNV